MIIVLLASSGAAWEGPALAALQADPGVVVLKRCVDVDDLLAVASTGQAEVAVMGTDLPGLDARVLDELARYEVRAVGVTGPETARSFVGGRTGLALTVDVDRVDALPGLLPGVLAGSVDDGGAGPASSTGGVALASRVPETPDGPSRTPARSLPPRPPGPPPMTAGESPTGGAPTAPPPPPPPEVATATMHGEGRVVAVWGPAGAPGRTTVTTALAGELAQRGLPTLLVDADPWGGAVAQQLGILDEVSGLLAAARLIGSPDLADRFTGTQRRLSERLRVLTGLPRADRWSEVRPGVLSDLVGLARRDAQVVLDTGFTIEQDLAVDLGRPGRNDLTREALELADDVVVVGSADPVGLARLVRALDEVREIASSPLVVVNRMRPTLGWRERDVVAMLEGFAGRHGLAAVHFLPDDQAAVDRAAVAGRLLAETGDSALLRALGGLVDLLAVAPGARAQALNSR
ncbi:CpaE family protein [Nocardioides sp.]|uniref:AAA family ATPase n=1 Tax=Nocardioides sp. TaxID=35761 RepID=UPI0035190DED